MRVGTRTSLLALSVAICLLAPRGDAGAQLFRLRHSPASDAQAWRGHGIEAVLSAEMSAERVAAADVVVALADGGFRVIPLSVSRNAIFGEIPGSLVSPPELRYYLRVTDVDGNTVIAPPGAPEGGLFALPIASGDTEVDTGAGAFAAETPALETGPSAGSGAEILSPAPGEVVHDDRPTIAALFSPPLEEPWDAFATLDGRNVTEEASVSSNVFVLTPTESLSVGAHVVTLSALTPVRTVDTSWTFFVRERAYEAESPWPLPEPAADGPIGETWSVVGRIDVGWTVVSADTTAGDSLDVFLPYGETSRPTIDFYASGFSGESSLLLTAQYLPVYGDELDWSLNLRTRSVALECGRVFPSLSSTTLDWASGLGGAVEASVSGATVKAVGMRMSEADTLAGFGIYSRFALGGMGTYRFGDSVEASVVYLSVYDREESVPEDQRLTDPLRNDVVAALAGASRGRLDGRLEIARSSASGETDGEGGAIRARIGYEKDLDNRIHLEYATSESGYYSAGSFEYEPGESAVELEFAWRPHARLRTTGWTRAGRKNAGQTTASGDEMGLQTYGRTELAWTEGGNARAYVVARYDRIPHESYDHLYSYGALGGSWRRSGTRVLGSVSWSRSRSPEATDTWSGSIDVRRDVVPGRWTVRAAGRWTAASGDGTDYLRSHYTLESRWSLGELDLEGEYWLIRRDDGIDASRSYTEHVASVSVGRSF